MQRRRLLPDTHPELTVLELPGFCEYRVENWHLARDGSGRVVNGTSGWTWRESVAVLILGVVWPRVRDKLWALAAVAIISLLLIWSKCTQVLFESVVVVPPHGLQLETHRGLPSWPLMSSRTFIPLISLHDFVINEALSRWNVRFYLAAIKQSGDEVSLQVAYENILPHFPVLLEVYRGVQESLFCPEANENVSSASE